MNIPNFYKQTESAYKSEKMGFGKGSIYNYGCYLVSLCNGLISKGYSYNPVEFNDLLKREDLFDVSVGSSKNYILVNQLHKELPIIFKGFEYDEPFRDNELFNYLKAGKIVIARVNARGLGRGFSGSHFVLVLSYDGRSASIIHDPWTGTIEPVTKKYRNYNNLLGLRVFDIKQFKPKSEEPTVLTSK
mgnify:CR=1 FL=1